MSRPVFSGSQPETRLRTTRRRRVRLLLRWVHVYVGLALSVLLFVLALSGGALVYKEAYWRLVYPELRAPAPALDSGDHAAAIAAAHARFGDALRSVKMPEPGVGAYHLYLHGGEAFLSAGDHRVLDRWTPTGRPMALLFDLHAHLMAGEAGERVGGVIALLGSLLVATGLWLWWPARRQLELKALPRDLSRRALVAWHRDIGTLTSPVVLLLLLTGAGLVFYEAARVLLNGALGDPVPAAAPAVAAPAGGPALPVADSALLVRVQARFPDARMVFYYPPAEGEALHRFRLKRACELHPNGRTAVYASPSGRILRADDACAMPPGERAVHALYPLHAAKTGSGVYKIVAFLGALALAGLSASGAVAYFRKGRRLLAGVGRPARGRAPAQPRR